MAPGVIGLGDERGRDASVVRAKAAALRRGRWPDASPRCSTFPMGTAVPRQSPRSAPLLAAPAGPTRPPGGVGVRISSRHSGPTPGGWPAARSGASRRDISRAVTPARGGPPSPLNAGPTGARPRLPDTDAELVARHPVPLSLVASWRSVPSSCGGATWPHDRTCARRRAIVSTDPDARVGLTDLLSRRPVAAWPDTVGDGAGGPGATRRRGGRRPRR
jgi:hypothetical protein